MRARRAGVIVVGAVAVLGAAWPLLAHSKGDTQADTDELRRAGRHLAVTSAQPAGVTVRLATGAFDPVRRVPDIPRGLAAASPRHWLVQLDGPVKTATREKLTAAGGQILEYLPDYTYVVGADARTADRLRDVEHVRWVGAYHPAYKLAPALTDARLAGRPLKIYPHGDADAAVVAKALARITGVHVREAGTGVVVADVAESARAAIARLESVQWVAPSVPVQLHNASALAITDTGMRGEYGAAAPGRLDGAGQTAAVADTGVNYIPDPNGRAQAAFSDCDAAGACKLADYLQEVPGNTTESLESVKPTGSQHRKMAGYFNLDADDPLPRSTEASWHGTHVSGSVNGDYRDVEGRYGARNREGDGLAPGARLIFQDVEANGGLGGLPGDPFDLFDQVYDLNKNGQYDATEDARTHNNSYGAIYPLLDDGGGARTDAFLYEHPDMVVVFSASNDGPAIATLAGGPQESKNVLTSCASANGSQPLVAPDAVAVFSSHGPTIDGRVKPDVCTPGQIIVSPKGGTTDADQYLQGTSMSGPVLVGLATLVRQYFWDGFGPTEGDRGYAKGVRDLDDRHNPSSALVKAVIINSAQRMRGAYSGDRGAQRADEGQWPSMGQGWGKVELDHELYFDGDDRALFTVDTPSVAGKGLETGIEVTEFVDVAPGEPLEVALAWTDPASALPAGSPVLVNDLDLVVIAPDGTRYLGNETTTQSPFVGTGGDAKAEIGQSKTGGLADRQNNVEKVRIAAPAAGRWSVIVRGQNVAQGTQGYGLAVSARLARDTSRVVFDRPAYRAGDAVTAYLLGTNINGDVAGFERLGPSVYRRTLTAAAGAAIDGGGISVAVPVDATPPTATAVEAESIAADLTRVRWNTAELTTGRVVVTTPEGDQTFPDVHVQDGIPGLETPQNETRGVYLNRPVISTQHFVNVTGLAPGGVYPYRIIAVDRAGNEAVVREGSITSTAAVFAPAAPDIAQLLSGDTTTGLPETDPQQWGTSTQLYAGVSAPLVAGLAEGFLPAVGQLPIARVRFMPAFMFRLPKSVPVDRITGAAVVMMSAHDIVNTYEEAPVYAMDLLASSVEQTWGPGTRFEEVDLASADAHLAPDPTERRGAGTSYAFHLACNDVEKLRANFSGDGGGEYRAAFRIRALTDSADALFSFETGYGRRSRGPQLRPRLVLFLDGQDPQTCTASTAAPRVTNVLVDHTTPTSAVVSWRTDVPSDSTAYFRKAGTAEWTPVSAPVRVTQHFVRISGLEPNGMYEFIVRSATCDGKATVDDNAGKAYALFDEAFVAPTLSAIHTFAAVDDDRAQVIGWSSSQLGTSVVRYGTTPTQLDKVISAVGDPSASHTVTLTDLAPCTRYFFVVETKNGAGRAGVSEMMAFDRPSATLTPVATFDFNADDGGWTMLPPGGNGELTDPALGTIIAPNPTVWERSASPFTGGTPAFRTVLEATGTPGYSSNVDIRLVSPPLTVPAGRPFVRFREWYELEGDGGFVLGRFERPEVDVSLDDGGSWTPVRTGTSSQNADFPSSSIVTLPLPPEAVGQTDVRISFRFRSDPAIETQGGGWSIDDAQLLNGLCAAVAGADLAPNVPLAPSEPPAEEAAAAANPEGITGPITPTAGASGAGVLPSLDVLTDAAMSAGTCRCGAIRYLLAQAPFSPGAPLPSVPVPQGPLPATGSGRDALPAALLFAAGLAIRRARRIRRMA